MAGQGRLRRLADPRRPRVDGGRRERSEVAAAPATRAVLVWLAVICWFGTILSGGAAHAAKGDAVAPGGEPSAGNAETAGNPSLEVGLELGRDVEASRTTAPSASAPLVLVRNESFACSVRVRPPATEPDAVLTVRYDLRLVGDGQTVDQGELPFRADADGSAESISIRTAVGDAPGVYELRVRLTRYEDRLWARLRLVPEVIAERMITCLVLPENAATEDEDSTEDAARADDWKVIGDMRAAGTSRWSVGRWIRTSPGDFLAGFQPKPLNKLDRLQHDGETVAAIAFGGALEATLPRREPGKPHKVKLRFAATADLNVRIDVVSGVAEEYQADGPALMIQSPPRRKGAASWETSSFVYYPSRRGEHLRLTNLCPDAPALLESIRVEAGPERLAAAEPRSEGDEPTGKASRLALIALEPHWWRHITRDLEIDSPQAGFSPQAAAWHRLFVAASRVADYARTLGADGVMIPAVDPPVWPGVGELVQGAAGRPDAALPSMHVLLQLFNRHHLNAVVEVDGRGSLASVENHLREHPELAGLVRRGPVRGGRPQRYNPLHPVVRESLIDSFRELGRQLNRHSNVIGIAIRCDSGSHLGFTANDPIDPTLSEQFIRLKPDSETPLSRRRARVIREARPELRRWMVSGFRDLFDELAIAVGTRQVLLVGEAASSAASHQWSPLVDSSWPPPGSHLRPTVASYRTSINAISSYLRLTQPTAGIAEAPPSRVDTFAVALGNTSAVDQPPILLTDATLADFGRDVDRHDPRILIVATPLEAAQLLPELSETLAMYRALPDASGARRPASDPDNQTVRMRVYHEDGASWWTLSNRAPWAAEVEMNFASGVQLSVAGVKGTAVNSWLNRGSDATRWTVRLPAGRWLVLGASDGAKLRGWSARPAEAEKTTDRVVRDVTWIVEQLGALADSNDEVALSNGGFERTGDVGLEGWLHAQHPPGAVQVDAADAFEGERSIVLTNDGSSSNRAWLVSEPVPTPQSGRLAVSLACRAEAAETETPHRLKVALEVTDHSGPTRHWVELQLPRDGEWQDRRIVLEADGLDPHQVESLRLTIDSLSSGRVWIDDIHLHDWFPTEAERGRLRSQAFLALQGLQRANLTAASRLLQNFWAVALLRESPPDDAAAAKESARPPQGTRGGITSRLRAWLPQPLRF